MSSLMARSWPEIARAALSAELLGAELYFGIVSKTATSGRASFTLLANATMLGAKSVRRRPLPA